MYLFCMSVSGFQISVVYIVFGYSVSQNKMYRQKFEAHIQNSPQFCCCFCFKYIFSVGVHLTPIRMWTVKGGVQERKTNNFPWYLYETTRGITFRKVCYVDASAKKKNSVNWCYLNFISQVYPNLPTVKGYTLWELIFLSFFFCKYNFLYYILLPFSHFGSNLFMLFTKKKEEGESYNLNKIRDTSHTFMIFF